LFRFRHRARDLPDPVMAVPDGPGISRAATVLPSADSLSRHWGRFGGRLGNRLRTWRGAENEDLPDMLPPEEDTPDGDGTPGGPDLDDSGAEEAAPNGTDEGDLGEGDLVGEDPDEQDLGDGDLAGEDPGEVEGVPGEGDWAEAVPTWGDRGETEEDLAEVGWAEEDLDEEDLAEEDLVEVDLAEEDQGEVGWAEEDLTEGTAIVRPEAPAGADPPGPIGSGTGASPPVFVMPGVRERPLTGRHERPAVPVPQAEHTPSPSHRQGLRETARSLEGQLGRTEVARVTVLQAAALVDADTATLLVRSVEGPRVLWHHPGDGAQALWGPATLAALLSAGRPVREVVEGDPLVEAGSTALLAVPVPSAGVLAGVLLARRVSEHSFSPAEEDALARLARMAGKALDAVARRGQVLEIPDTDPVTGFWLRDRLMHDLRAALRSAEDHGMPSSLLLVEVTGLHERRGSVHDPAADSRVSALAKAVVRELRVGDVPYRFGHDEIAVLLPGTDLGAAAAVAARFAGGLSDLPDEIRVEAGYVAVEGVAEDVVLAAGRTLDAGTAVAAAAAAEDEDVVEDAAMGVTGPVDDYGVDGAAEDYPADVAAEDYPDEDGAAEDYPVDVAAEDFPDEDGAAEDYPAEAHPAEFPADGAADEYPVEDGTAGDHLVEEDPTDEGSVPLVMVPSGSPGLAPFGAGRLRTEPARDPGDPSSRPT
ncbi:MAG: diguanylate cyclase, partial [Kineosporiaceae bacterium]